MGLLTWFKEKESPKKVKKLPEDPIVGKQYLLDTPKGERIFKAKKEEGFGKYQMVSMKNYKKEQEKENKHKKSD
jgi:hypothetical protein